LYILCIKVIYKINNDQSEKKWVINCGIVEVGRDEVTEETEAMEKTELTQPHKGCQHHEIIFILLIKKSMRLPCFSR
jgi:hypothetical protein